MAMRGSEKEAALSAAISAAISCHLTGSALGSPPELWLVLFAAALGGLMTFWLARKRPDWFSSPAVLPWTRRQLREPPSPAAPLIAACCGVFGWWWLVIAVALLLLAVKSWAAPTAAPSS
jgi:hypothetical protein